MVGVKNPVEAAVDIVFHLLLIKIGVFIKHVIFNDTIALFNRLNLNLDAKQINILLVCHCFGGTIIFLDLLKDVEDFVRLIEVIHCRFDVKVI